MIRIIQSFIWLKHISKILLELKWEKNKNAFEDSCKVHADLVSHDVFQWTCTKDNEIYQFIVIKLSNCAIQPMSINIKKNYYSIFLWKCGTLAKERERRNSLFIGLFVSIASPCVAIQGCGGWHPPEALSRACDFHLVSRGFQINHFNDGSERTRTDGYPFSYTNNCSYVYCTSN